MAPFLKSKFPNFVCIAAALEEHPETGGWHIHAYIDGGSNHPVINDSSFLDFCDTHPNILPVRTTPWKSHEYVLKDGNILFEEGTAPEAPNKSASDEWALIAEAPTADEFLNRAVKTKPRDSLLHFSSLQAYASWRYRKEPDPYTSCELICHCEKYPQLTEWVQTYLHRPYRGRPKSLILFGATRLGKTLWARSLGKHAYFPGLFLLEDFNEEKVDFALFDDLVHGMHTLPNAKHWLGGQTEFVIGDKYMKKRRIRWGKPSIYISNPDPRGECTTEMKEWMKGNCICVEIKDQLAEPYIE